MIDQICVDLETLGVKGDAVFLSIAAIKFDKETGELGDRFKRNISLDSALKLGLKVEEQTLKWWMDQRIEHLKAMFVDSVPIQSALLEFSIFIKPKDGIQFTLWGNSARFDLQKISTAYNLLGLKEPWDSYGHERCYKTYAKDFPSLRIEKDMERAHDPMYDCEFQIKQLCYIWSKIKNPMPAMSGVLYQFKKPVAIPTEELCDLCDGCGWYEGGPTLKTVCEICNGTGIKLKDDGKEKI